MKQELLPEDLPENLVATETLFGILLLHQNHWAEAEEAFLRAVQRLDRYPYVLLFANPYMWLAHLYLQKGWQHQVRSLMAELFALYKMEQFGALLLREGYILEPILELMPNHTGARQILRLLCQYHKNNAVPIPHSTEFLTPREMEVLRLMACGARNHEIAETLFITVRTVKAHVSRILAKFDAKSRTHAISKAQQLGLI
ncbi:MAG: hypothetical protein D6813_12905 [Calditrichaeota bacterium]|nr:MAG: hypothetical protein D6813_12905 [Calditrichota bacterium]